MSLLRMGTRGSALALAQSHHVKKRLESLSPDLRVELQIIKTTGDRLANASLSSIGGKGVFTKELEEALLSHTVDLAVHSLKDLPTELPSGLDVGAILEREDPRDCLVSRFGEQLMELPRGAVIGTSSLRRQAQIRAIKKRIRIEDLRGNLDTRLARVAAGDYSAVVVAYAGVRRLGRADEVTEVLSPEVILPAPGQGFVAIETRAEDPETLKWVSQLNHGPSQKAAIAERSFLSALGGGCRVPIAAYAREDAGQLILDGRVTSVDGKNDVKGTETGLPADAKKIGHVLAHRLLAKGALGILELLAPAQ
ncbi:MAG: hydroxymethylbilane synthase [Elusimicrobia bacterium]|nr:hydroxymethylbilane synthase [Elusimicrobiota bacterium]